MLNLKVNASTLGFSVYAHISQYALACAEFTIVQPDVYSMFTLPEDFNPCDKLAVFNRIFVPQPNRRQGVATALLKESLKTALGYPCHIHCVVRSYSGPRDAPNDDLVTWYSKHGFEPINGDQRSLFFNYRKLLPA